jgi:Ca-activated chloride channel family protein
MRTISFIVAAVAAAAFAGSSVAIAAPDPDAHPRLTYLAADGARAELPLVQSKVDAVIRGPIAQVTLTQTYANPLTTAVDAVYMFPLPDSAAVGGMVLTSGDRRVRAVIRRRADARAVYDKAKREGKMAALLDQERPNVFTQSIANLAPLEQVGVELSFDVLLELEDGAYQLALPTVIGPRYIPGTELAAPAAGSGTQRDTDQVPDASRISPPVSTGTGNVVDVAIDLDAGVPVTQVESPTHKLAITKRGDTARTIALANGATAADRDVVITWRVAVTQPTIAALADHDGERGHVALIVQPPPTPPARSKDAPAREIVFVVDTSGSMKGKPLELAQAGMRRALAGLRPIDRFRIVNFSTGIGGLDDGASLLASKPNVERGLGFVNDLESAGGTEMMSGVKAALARPAPDMTTYVCFMTDGFIGNETEVLGLIARELDPQTRLFSFGIGSSVNRFLLDRMAKVGRGAADYVLPGDDNADAVIDRFLARLDTPVLGDLEIDWGGLDLVDQTPDTLPELFAGQPIVIVARYGKGGAGEITITGKRGGKQLTYKQQVVLPASGGSGRVLGRLWARRRIEALDRIQDTAGAKPELERAITDIALAHGLMSAYTSFVAVEERTTRDVAGHTVVVPVELPAGVSAEGVGTGEYWQDELGSYRNGSPAAEEEDDALGVRHRRLSPGVSLGSAAAEAYVLGGLGREGRWHGSLDAGLAIATRAEAPVGGEQPARTGYAVNAAIERRLAGRFGAGLEASLLGRTDRDNLATFSAVLARWSILSLLHLRAGLGAAWRSDGELGLAWHLRAGFAIPLARSFGPELSVRLGQARIDPEDDAVTVGIGLGLRF